MNILIPHTWLLEHLETDVSPQEIQKLVSLCGPSVERIYDREGEAVYDIEVTTNRVDSMSVRGIAREVAIILDQFGHQASLKPLQLGEVTLTDTDSELPLPDINNSLALCKRITCVILANVDHTPTPEWMAKRLRQIDEKVHDSVIDITNYITHELGHPCHAFDYDAVMKLGGVMNVVEAKPNQTFITLDGERHQTLGGEVVFTNKEGTIIDLPAIKGTANSSVTDETKNVLLWIESMDAKKVRFASMSHAIRTVAAQLNEKNVDPNLADQVIEKGVELYQEHCHATIASHRYDEFVDETRPALVALTDDDIYRYLGVKIEPARITQILEALGCEVTSTASSESEVTSYEVVPPTFRPDIQIPADVVEEIARIYGYHNLPSTLMDTAIPTSKQEGVNFAIEQKLNSFLVASGWQEVYCYSMVSEELAKQSGYDLADHLKLQNPLTDDCVYLRRSLIPSLKEILHQNPQRQDVRVFELANVYVPQGNDIPTHDLQLALLDRRPYRQVRTELDSLLHQIFIDDLTISESIQAEPPYSQTASISVESPKGKVELGKIEITSEGWTAITLEFGQLLAVAKTHPSYQPLPKTAPVIEDLTFTLTDKQPVGPIITEIKSSDPLVTKVEVVAVYQQNVSFRISYHDPENNLDNQQVAPLRKKIVSTLQKKFQTELVGELNAD
jgi:phenylalanyl-tRNA synthetase beta chain